jgi:hypothetical protein
MPTATDLVTDLPADFETFGQAVATSMADLLGGTTGQVLSKASNTNMDFTWVTSDDTNAIQNAIVDAKGDLIAASAADTPARLAVGNNGETLVADSSTSTGLRYRADFAAGKNKIINGDFGIWQRGTSFTSTGNNYWADRWTCESNVTNRTLSQQTFTPGTAPVAGYEGTYFARYATTQTGSFSSNIRQHIEDVRTLAGQTATISFWMKADSARTIPIGYAQVFGSGGSGTVAAVITSFSVTTSWQRFTATFSVPSISGKTIGTNSYLLPFFSFDNQASATIDIWGVQLEAGSVATAFQTATGTIQGELSACQRYYQKSYNIDVAPASSTTVGATYFLNQVTASFPYVPTTYFRTQMRTTPTITLYGVTGTSGKITNNSTDVNGLTQGVGSSGFGAYVNNVSITAGNELKFQWTAEIEL